MHVLITFASLFLSVIFVQLGSGAVVPLDAISGLSFGFSRGEVGLLGSAHFVGFFAGCWWAPRLMGAIGHSRAFSVFTAMGTIAIAAHMMIPEPVAWLFLRTITGLSVAGSYTIIEGWLQASLSNATRGRTMGIYRIVDIGASLMAQLMIGTLTPSSYFSYNLLAILCCAALLPLALSRATQPATPPAPRLRPRFAWDLSPFAAVAVIGTGITGAAFRFVGPVYGEAVGLRLEQIGYFLAIYVAGGWLAQIPMGWLADRFERRKVMIALLIAAAIASLMTIALAGAGSRGIYVSAGLFGFATLPIYSIAAAHANDFAKVDQTVELAASLLFLYALGAIASPLIAALLIDHFGPSSMFWFLALVQLAIAGFGVMRMRVRPAPDDRTAYTWIPRTSMTVGRLLGRTRNDEH